MLFGVGDIAEFVTSRDLAFAPGTYWEYANASSNVISAAIRNVLGDRATYLAFPRRALFDPLGMSSAVLETDAAGTFIGSSYVYATARDWARFGMLYLRDGIWNGARILPPGWVDISRDLPDVVFAAEEREAGSTIIIVDLPKQELGTLASCQKLETLFTLKKHPRDATSELTNTGGLASCTVTLWFETEVETRVIFGTPDHPFDFGCTGPNRDDVIADCTSARTSIRFRARP